MEKFIGRVTDRRRGIMVEAVYVPTPDGKYRNTHWRLHTATHGWGEWYKIHGNQKKGINPQLSLVRHNPPVPDCELTAEELFRATQRGF